MRLLLHAPNVHTGGGLSLLGALLRAQVAGVHRHITIDERCPLPDALQGDVTVERIAPSLTNRFLAELRLRSRASAEDVVLCFGNLPPLFRLRAPTTLFLQNRHLVDLIPEALPLRMKARLCAERLWLRSRARNVDRLIVQTPTMRRLAQDALNVRADVLPFLEEATPAAAAGPRREPAFDFIYVSSGESHKNHDALIEACRLLALEDVRPRVCVTLSPELDALLCRKIEAARRTAQVDITNIGTTPVHRVHELYAQAGALIFPSLGESFGLPLLEAAALGLPILAPEADYVRDVVDPIQTFDPTSAVSIARAIKRYLGVSSARALPTSPEGFLADVVRVGARGNPAGGEGVEHERAVSSIKPY